MTLSLFPYPLQCDGISEEHSIECSSSDTVLLEEKFLELFYLIS